MISNLVRTLRLLALLAGAVAVAGCGYKELPVMKDRAENSFKNMLIQYRLRADLVPHFLKLAEGNKALEVTDVVKAVTQAHSHAVAMDMPPAQFDEKQMNRFQSFQYALDHELVHMREVFDKDPKIAKSGEYLSLKTQLEQIGTRVAMAQQQFSVEGPAYNTLLAKVPEKWFNRWLYKFQPIPVLENSAAH